MERTSEDFSHDINLERFRYDFIRTLKCFYYDFLFNMFLFGIQKL